MGEKESVLSYTEVKEKSLLLALHLLHNVPSVPVNRTPPPQMKPRVRAGVLMDLVIIVESLTKLVDFVVNDCEQGLNNNPLTSGHSYKKG